MKKTRALALALACALSLSLLTACGGSGSGSDTSDGAQTSQSGTTGSGLDQSGAGSSLPDGSLPDASQPDASGDGAVSAGGSASASQLRHAMSRELDVDALAAQGNLAPITAWLRERIHRHGNLYDPRDLLKRATGEDFNPEYYVAHLTRRATER